MATSSTPPSAGSPGLPSASTRAWDRVRRTVVGASRRAQLLAAMTLVVAWLDYRLHSQALPSLAIAAVAVVGFVRRRALAPVVRRLGRALPVPDRFKPIVAVTLPAIPMYLFRLRGALSMTAGLLVVLTPTVVGLALVMFRDRLDELMAPVFDLRDEHIRPAWRFPLVFILPLLITFTIAQGSPRSILAFFNIGNGVGQLATGREPYIIASLVLSTLVVYLLAHEPRPGATSRPARTTPAAGPPTAGPPAAGPPTMPPPGGAGGGA